jgi:hypothetical protein
MEHGRLGTFKEALLLEPAYYHPLGVYFHFAWD